MSYNKQRLHKVRYFTNLTATNEEISVGQNEVVCDNDSKSSVACNDHHRLDFPPKRACHRFGSAQERGGEWGGDSRLLYCSSFL